MARMVRIQLPVADLDAAMEFYTHTLMLPAKKISESRASLFCKGIELICYDPLLEGKQVGKGWMLHENQDLYFGVTNLEATYIRAKNSGCSEIDAATSINERGETVFHCKDPSGNPLCFVDEKTMSDDPLV